MEWSLVGLAGIITAMVGVFKFFDERAAKKNGEALKVVNGKLDAIAKEFSIGQKQDRLSIMRLEMMMLMRIDPDNVVEIEKVARDYFSQGGNWYLTGIYSSWAKQHGGDITFVTQEK